MSQPRWFPNIGWENLAAREAAEEEDLARLRAAQADVATAQRLADISFAQPQLPGGVAAGAAVAGLTPGSPELDQIAEAERRYGRPEQTRGTFHPYSLWEGASDALKGTVRTLFTLGESFYDEVVKGTASTIVGTTQYMAQGHGFADSLRTSVERSYGQSTGAMAIAALRQGQPVNLGSGFFPSGDLSETTSQRLSRGASFGEAIANPGQAQLGVPLRQMRDHLQETKAIQLPSRAGYSVPVTPGRAIVSTVLDPADEGFGFASGLIDGAANIFLDPTAKLGGAAADLRQMNRALVPNARKPAVLTRSVEDWVSSGHGARVSKFLADSTDYHANYGILRSSNPNSPANARIAAAITEASDPAQVAEILRSAVLTGNLENVLGRQGLLGRALGTSGVAGAVARGVGAGGGLTDIAGIRQLVFRDRLAETFVGRWSAQVGARAIRLDDINKGTEDFGQWMQAAGLSTERIGHYMHRFSRLETGQTESAYGIVGEAIKEWGATLDDVPDDVVRAFTDMFGSVDKHRRYMIDQAGNDVIFPGGKYTINLGGQVVALPSAQLFSEFMDIAIPLIDARQMRMAMRRWGPRTLDDMDPKTITKLADFSMQKLWKPAVLLRLAWPVRVIGEEQIRLAGAGMDSAMNHPAHAIALALGLADDSADPDVLGRAFSDSDAWGRSMSHKGGALGDRHGRQKYSDEWVLRGHGEDRHAEGWAIELRHLSADPIGGDLIAQRVFPEVLEEGIDATHLLDPERITSVLGEVKEEFFGSDMWRRLVSDGQRWDILNNRWAADAYIDSVWARMVVASGGDIRYFDHVKGEWRDAWGNLLDPEGLTRPILRGGFRGNDLDASDRLTSLSTRLSRLGRTIDTGSGDEVARSFDELVDLVDEIDEVYDGIYPNRPEVDRVRSMVDDWSASSGATFDEIREGIRTGIADFDDIDEAADFIADGITRLRAGLGSAQNDVGDLAHVAKYEAIPAREIQLLYGSGPEVERLYSGYRPNAGRLGREELGQTRGLNVDETVDRAGNLAPIARNRPQAVPDQPVGTYRNPATTEIHGDGSVSHTIEAVRDLDGTPHMVGFVTVRRNADGRLVDVDLLNVSGVGDQELVSGTTKSLLDAVMKEAGEGDELVDLLMGGVPMRQWLEDVVPDAASMTEREMLEYLRDLGGDAWTELAPKMNSVQLTEQGAKTLGTIARHFGRGRGTTTHNPVSEWPAHRLHYEMTKAPNPEVLEAIARGNFRGLNLKGRNILDDPKNEDSIRALGAALSADEAVYASAPQQTKVARLADRGRFDALDETVDRLMNALMSVPTNKLSRSPAFKQFYWRQVAELLPMMDEATQVAALKAARSAGLGRGSLRDMASRMIGTDPDIEAVLTRMARAGRKGGTETAAGGITSLEQLDEVAKAYALSRTQELLYDLNKRSNFFDMTRNIFPFGEAWLEIITTWSRLMVDNPALIRRAQQGVEGLRNSGVFYTDPATGEEVFNFPVGPFADLLVDDVDDSDAVSASPTFTGRASGLNLALGSFVPGVGPLVQLPAANLGFINDDPQFRWLRDIIFPFGVPEARNPSDIAGVLTPTWMRKALAAIGAPQGDDERLYNNTVIDVYRAMVTNGEIDESDRESLRQGLETARKRAKGVYVIRALSSFAGPTGASVRWDVENDETGEMFAFQVLATEYAKMADEAGGDRVAAFERFAETFGTEPTAFITPKSTQIRPRSVTDPGLDFQQNNPELFDEYPLTAYYLRPDGPEDEFDYSAYLAQIREGDRVPTDPDRWAVIRNQTLGQMAYERARVAIGDAKDSEAGRAWLRNVRMALMERYQGYGYDTYGVVARADTTEVQNEFELLAADESLREYDAMQGLRPYLRAREWAITQAQQAHGVSPGGFANAKSTQYLRDWLYSVAQSMGMQHPDFAPIFDRWYAWETDNPDPEAPPTELGGVSMTPGSDQ